MPRQFVEKDRGWKQIEREVSKFKSKVVAVGVLKGTDHKGSDGRPSASLALIAAVQEFGARIRVTPRMRAYLHAIGIHLSKGKSEVVIPERSFLRSWANAKKDQITRAIASMLKKVESGEMTAEQGMKTLGVFAVSGVQKQITEPEGVSWPPLKIRQGRPLIDTGGLRQGIKYEVREMGGGVE